MQAQIVFLVSTLSEANWLKNRDEIHSVRSRGGVREGRELTSWLQLIELHGKEPQLHLIRRLIIACSSLLAPANPHAIPPNPSQPSPEPSLALRLLASEVQRMARDPATAERFKEAVVQSPDGPTASPDSVLRSFSLSTLLAQPALAELSPLERLVFASPFLTLLNHSTASQPAATGLKRALGVDAALTIRNVLPQALDQLGSPAASQQDLPDLSPISISKLFSILLSDLTTGEREGDGPQVFQDDDRRAIIFAAVKGRLGTEVGSQALAHAVGDMSFSPTNPPTPIALLSRLSPAAPLCSFDLVRAVLARFGGIPSHEAEAIGGGMGGGHELRVAAMLCDLVDLATKDADLGAGIDLSSWVRAVHDLQPALRWSDVVRAYDTPSRALPDSWGLRLFAAFLPLSPSPSSQFPQLVSREGGTSAISGLWSPWANPHLQFALIERLLYLPPEAFNLGAIPGVTKVVSVEDAASASPTIKALAASAQGSVWNCRELVATLVRLSEANPAELATRVHDVLERGCKSNPELVLIALVQVEVRPLSLSSSSSSS